MKSTFLHVGHSLLPLLSAVVMHSEQNLCRHSFVVIVFLKTSRQIGHMSNALSDFRCTFIRGYKFKVLRIFNDQNCQNRETGRKTGKSSQKLFPLISVSSSMSSCGFRFSSYRLSSNCFSFIVTGSELPLLFSTLF